MSTLYKAVPKYLPAIGPSERAERSFKTHASNFLAASHKKKPCLHGQSFFYALVITTRVVIVKVLLRVFCVSSVADSFAFFVGRVTNGISLVFEGISLSFAFSLYFIALGLHLVFGLAVARGERKGHSSYGEKEYFFHGAG